MGAVTLDMQGAQAAGTGEAALARITRHANLLSAQLQALSASLFPPAARKSLRTFSSGEAAKLLGVSDGYLRQLSLDGLGPTPALSARRNARSNWASDDSTRESLSRKLCALSPSGRL